MTSKQIMLGILWTGLAALPAAGAAGDAGEQAVTKTKPAHSTPTIARNQPQLFLDDLLVAKKDNIRRIWHKLRKHPANPLFGPSGDERALYLFGTVLRERPPGKTGKPIFRMWYYAMPRQSGRMRKYPSTHVAYATSRDGLKWVKPNLGLIEINGNRRNNAVFRTDDWVFHGLSGMIRDPRPNVPAAERYKLVIPGLITRPQRRKIYLGAVSPDGLRWTFRGALPIDGIIKSDRACFTWDPYRKACVLYCRDQNYPPAFARKLKAHYAKTMSPERAAKAAGEYWGRAVALATSKDFRTWSKAEQVLRINVDREPLGLQIYGMAAIPYGGQWVSLWQRHWSLPEQAYLDIGIAHSRDGRTWHRRRDAVLPCGEPGEWDRFNQCVSTRVVTVGDELWFYYSGRTYRHGEYRRHTDGKDTGPHSTAGGVHIGLATLRLDGFCSLEASFDGGTVETKPVVLPPGELFVNCRSRWGRVTVEVLDKAGRRISGGRSEPVVADSVRQKIIWPKSFSLKKLAGRPIRLRFTLANAQLYSWGVK